MASPDSKPGAEPANTGEEPTLMKILSSPSFSDLKVHISPTKQTFNLHREILSSTSTFFKDFSLATKSAGIAEIHLPHLSTTAFSQITKWQYDGGITFTFDEKSVEIFKTIEFLRIPSLRREFWKQLKSFCRGMCTLNATSRAVFLGTFNMLCKYFKPDDLEDVICCMVDVITHFVVVEDLFLEAMEKGKVCNLFVVGVLGARRRVGHWGVCGGCFSDVKGEGKVRVKKEVKVERG
ncbi:hypothetical protein TWF481_003177 [Arthrobotrys musiformis]|uniref:BTB domain-containing protein n=1 Tax=Arthrobotrys musiformis TaxID=47236 RepID=A0AAV9VRN9_9PEZI